MLNNNQKQIDEFAALATERYDAFIAWMIEQWPQRSDPLTVADFSAGKREMSLLLGAKLHAGGDSAQVPIEAAAKKEENNSGQYLPVTPAPWP